MKSNIEVESRDEGKQIQNGLDNARLRTLTRVAGILTDFNTADQQWIVQRASELIKQE